MLLEYSVSFHGDMTLSLHFWDRYSLLSISELVAPLRQVWYLIHFYVLGDTVPGILKIKTSSVSEHCLFTHVLCFLANLQWPAFPVSSVLGFLPCTCTHVLPLGNNSHNKTTVRILPILLQIANPVYTLPRAKMNSVALEIFYKFIISHR